MKILYVEDEMAHVELTQRTLEDNLKEGFVLLHCASCQDALEILNREPDVDVVLSDLRLPDGSGLDLLKRIQERPLPPVVVLVTGQGDEQVAVAALKAGAADYLVKQSDYLHRLPVVITNAVAQNNLAREQAEKREAQARYQSLVEQIPAVVFLDALGENETTLYISPRIQELTGFSPEEWMADASIWENHLHPDDKGRILEAEKVTNEKAGRFNEEYRFIRCDGRVIWIKEDTNLIYDKDGNPLYWQGIMLDVTKEKESEAALQRQLKELKTLNAITLAGTESTSEDEIIERVVRITSSVYDEVCGVLLLDDQANVLTPHPSYFGANVENWKNGTPIAQGITGKSVLLGRPIRIGDVSQEPAFIEIATGIRSELCVPIRVNKRIIGIFNIESGRLNAFDEEDEQFAGTVAGTLGTALENVRLYESERIRRREAEYLQEATASLSTHIELEPLLEQILTSIQKIIPYDSSSIFLGTNDGDMKIIAAKGFSDEEKIVGKKIPNTAKWHELVNTRRSLIMPDAQDDPRFEKWEGSKKIRGWMGIPMITQDKVVGFINLDSHRVNAFTERDAMLAQTFANSAAVAIQNAILFRAEREQRKREESMLELMRITTSTLELDAVMQTILQHMLGLIPSNSGTIQLLEGENLRIAATQGFAPGVLIPRQILPLEHSPIKQQALDTIQPVWTNNTQQDPNYRLMDGVENVNSFMVVPLVYKGNVIGLATLDSNQINRYTTDDADFAFAIANQAAIAIGNARLYQEALMASERRAVLHRISQDIVRFTQDPEQIYAAIHDAAGKLMPCDVFLITLADDAKSEITAVYAVEAGKRYTPESVPAGRGFSAGIIREGKSIILQNDADIAETKAVRFGSPKRVRSVVAVPMRIGDKVIGMISAQSYFPNSYGSEEQSLLEMLATHAATAIENARLFQEESRRTRIIETLVDIANEIATTQDIIPVLDKITHRAMELLRANHVAIYLLHDDNNTLKVITAQGQHRQELLSQAIKVGEGITGSVVASRRSEIIDRIADDHRRVHLSGTPESDADHETMMSAPLILRGKCIGALNAWRLRTNGVFSRVELSFLTSIANQVSVAIESANLFKETVRRAQESAAIAEVGRDISATLQLDVVLNRIASYAKELLNSESSAVYLLDLSKPVLKAIAAQGLETDQILNDPLEIGTGILGNIALNKIGEIVNDTLNDPRAILIKGTDKNPYEHIMGVPVLEKDQLTGLVVVWRSGIENEFKPSDLDFLGSLAQQAATAIKNARLYDEAQRRLREVETINRLSSSMRGTQSQTEMCNILLDETLDLLDAQNGSVWIHDPSTNMVVQRAARGAATKIRYPRLKPDEGIVGHVFTTGKAYVSLELKSDPHIFQGNRDVILEGYGGAGIPINSTDGILGVLVVQIESRRRVNDHISLLGTLAEIAGNAIHRADLFDQSQEQVRKLTTLRDIDSAIASSTDLRVTLNILMDHTLRHLKIDAVDILLYHSELQSLTYLCSAGFRSASPTRPLMRIGEGLAGQVVMKGRTEHIPDLQAYGEIRRDPLLAREGFVSYIGIPLIVKGQIKGLFEIFHRSPLTPNEEWMQFMQTLSGQAAIAIDNSQLFDNLQRSNQEIRQAYDTTLEGWARALELRDRETEGHTRRVTRLTMDLARYMNISEDDLVNIYRGVLLHDIGKMGVPDQILRKTGPLTDPEWVEMRKHPQYAFDLLAPIPYLRPALDIPYCHHEHWDGSGYPRGLKGEQIPLAARIFSIIDIWDALLSDRPYRDAWPEEKVIAYLKEISGKILDPKVVDAFLQMTSEEEN
ncbi:MAG: GAF domain-containing protein [Anaerolineales bacterium]|nr:GAF domain-containing protein [Anaerolineales bacterium]